MKNVPKKIYLNIDDDASETSDFNGLFSEAVTWSEDRVNDSDVEFVRVNDDKLQNVRKGVGGSLPIDFAVYLTGHDKETIEQMYNDWQQ